jgi:ribosomal 50S subunit-recycling heat shock protein
MRNCLAQKILSIAMMVLTPAAMLMAETGNTMLYASGNVTLNGTEVARSASVTPGDRIDTAGATATTVSQDGSKVTVTPYSSVRYESAAVRVDRGTAAITTTDGMTATAAQITVTPKDKAATYEIARLNNQIVITSQTGALMVTEAGKTTEVEAGASSSRTADPTPAPAPAPQAAPVFPGYDLTARQVFAIAAVVGGAAIACGLWCGMAAAGVPPGGFGNQLSTTTHQARGMNRVISVARVAATPVLNGVANNARNNNNTASRVGQHRNVHVAAR